MNNTHVCVRILSLKCSVVSYTVKNKCNMFHNFKHIHLLNELCWVKLLNSVSILLFIMNLSKQYSYTLIHGMLVEWWNHQVKAADFIKTIMVVCKVDTTVGL